MKPHPLYSRIYSGKKQTQSSLLIDVGRATMKTFCAPWVSSLAAVVFLLLIPEGKTGSCHFHHNHNNNRVDFGDVLTMVPYL